MIRDRDGLTNEQIEEIELNGKIKCLKKRHIENYFLDSELLFKVAERLCTTALDTRLNQPFIDSELKRIARSLLNLNLLLNIKEYLMLNHSFEIPTVRDVESKTSDAIRAEMNLGVQDAINKLQSDLSQASFGAWIDSEKLKLANDLENGEWINTFAGKGIFAIFCSSVLRENPMKVRQAYVDIALSEKPEVFGDIIEIFTGFSS